MNKTMQCTLDAQGVLIPDNAGNIAVNIIEHQDDDGIKTAAIVFGGQTQGFVNFDSTQNKAIGVIPTDPNIDPNVEQSLINICNKI